MARHRLSELLIFFQKNTMTNNTFTYCELRFFQKKFAIKKYVWRLESRFFLVIRFLREACLL